MHVFYEENLKDNYSFPWNKILDEFKAYAQNEKKIREAMRSNEEVMTSHTEVMTVKAMETAPAQERLSFSQRFPNSLLQVLGSLCSFCLMLPQ